MMRLLLCLVFVALVFPQAQQTKPSETVYLLRPARVFDGESAQLRDNWVVLVRGEKIEAVVPDRGSRRSDAGRGRVAKG